MKRRKRIKLRYLVVGAVLLSALMPRLRLNVGAKSCPNLNVIFARGSGEQLETSESFNALKNSLGTKLAETSLSYDFTDLDYQAIGITNATIAVGAFFGAGEAYAFGDSITSGVQKLADVIENNDCPGTRYILWGYSQGAMVIEKALPLINPEKVIYVVTFGDPKIYLPEGEGLFPAACGGRNLSSYRMYVPDCHAYKGLLGANMPYEPEGFANKIGTWCNKNDIFCSSHFNINHHISYVKDDLYEDAAKVVYNKIIEHFGLENQVLSLHDTAFLIDTSGSMRPFIDNYKDQAIKLAKETLEMGGRIALFDYRDLNDPYQTMERCNFENCTLAMFEEQMNLLGVEGGGDEPESLLSASFSVMKTLKWRFGSTKSIVVLTDADFLSPDRDGVSLDEVVKLSKEIDPVNFYIITQSDYLDAYKELTELTDGGIATDGVGVSRMMQRITRRFDALPKVEEDDASSVQPTINSLSVIDEGSETIKIKFSGNSNRAILVLNDALVGIANTTEIELSELNRAVDNLITLIPISDNVKGEAKTIVVPKVSTITLSEEEAKNPDAAHRTIDSDNPVNSSGWSGDTESVYYLVPKVPNTGRKE